MSPIDLPPCTSDPGFLERTEVRKNRTDDPASDEVEGNWTRVFASDAKEPLPHQVKTVFQPSTSPKDANIHPAATRGGDSRNLQSIHEFAVTKLPPELLSLIFTNCRGWLDFSVTLPRTQWFPWVLGHVCSRWRRTLHSMSEIWSNIGIRSYLPQWKQEVLPWLIDQIMPRARSSISLHAPLLEIDVFTKIITPYAGRFHSLRLTLSFDLLGVFLNFPFSFTSLRALQVYIENGPLVRPFMTRQTDSLQRASHLDTLYLFYPCDLNRISPTYSLSGLWFPWSQLTFFECGGAHSISALHNVLSQCATLTKCLVMVRESLEGEMAGYTHQPIILPRRCNLSIQSFFDESADWLLFLGPFVLPSLEILQCHDWEALEAFNSLVARSECHLKELACFMEPSFADPPDTDDICNLLRMSPSLSLLGIIPLWPEMFTLISCGNLLPCIATLECCVDKDGLDAFIEFMKQYPQGQGIQKARIFLYISLNYVDYGASEKDAANRRFLNALERFVPEGRDITMQVLD